MVRHYVTKVILALCPTANSVVLATRASEHAICVECVMHGALSVCVRRAITAGVCALSALRYVVFYYTYLWYGL